MAHSSSTGASTCISASPTFRMQNCCSKHVDGGLTNITVWKQCICCMCSTQAVRACGAALFCDCCWANMHFFHPLPCLLKTGAAKQLHTGAEDAKRLAALPEAALVHQKDHAVAMHEMCCL